MTSAVIVSLRVKAEPARAFDVFTQEIALWWRPNQLFQLTPRGDGRLRFEGEAGGRLLADLDNGKTYEIGAVSVWVPGEKLAFSWRPASVALEQATEVIVTFEPVGAKTRVTVEHRGWAEIPRENAVRHGFPDAATLQRAGEWWRGELAALAQALARP